MKKLNCFLILFSAFSQLVFSQQKTENTFEKIRNHYEKMTIDDIRAMSFVNTYIEKAKKEKNYLKLMQGYRDGRQFDYINKLKYADSAIAISVQYGTKDDVSKDHLSKGVIYYYYFKNYKSALSEYLKAYELSKGSKDGYHHHKIIYHLGVVKEHLGYYQEAWEHFNDCASFYSKELHQALHENLQFNYKKAYLNSIHQMSVVSRLLKNYASCDSLNHLGYKLSLNDKDFVLENSYFLKEIGILKYHKKNYQGAIKDLTQSLPAILRRNDFSWVSVVYFYLGKSFEAQNRKKEVIQYYSWIDSIFEKQHFLSPEVYPSYNYLIEYYKKRDLKKQLYYTNQLLEADSLLSKDYPYLSLNLHKDYDRQSILEAKNNIENVSRRKILFAKIIIVSGALLLAFLIIRSINDRKIKKQYDLLQKRIAEGTYNMSNLAVEEPSENSLRKTFLTPKMTAEIKEKLEKFENELQFRKKGLTQKSIANRLNTNSHYLSIYINENKGMNFNKYMAQLRINYITNLLNTNNKYLHYTIEALAEECGIAARQNFSNLFFEINGIRPTDYIKKRKQDLGIS
ncbi:AraC family transcriptional regulator [Chryseobacterium sp. 2TAF14]|uniref:helix-turn-helix domain-containing protein n=1 Tax=Chryseobacterium sp. 2TAF14 TaxID=3233007 RepID=UPI003F908303